MRKLQNYRCLLGLTVALASCLLTADTSFAAKGGNGGGKPGGGDPPASAAPVNYAVTPVSIPGTSFYFNDHNESAAIVGWTSGGVGRRAMAYLPSISPSKAFYLDDPDLGVTGIPSGWHTRSAIGVNNHGDIVGNLEPFAAENSITKAFYLDNSGATPQLTVLGPFDPNAVREHAAGINDSGDIIVHSERIENDTYVRSFFVGNPGLYGNPAVPFQKLDILQLGSSYELADSVPLLSNRIGGGPALITGHVREAGSSFSEPFRMSLDGNQVELGPNYTDSEGDIHILRHSYDINDLGQVTGQAVIRARPSGGKFNLHAAVWNLDSNELVTATETNPWNSEWTSARTNNDGDLLLGGYLRSGDPTQALWQEEWSAENGTLNIAGLLDPNDEDRHLYQRAIELTDHRGNDWPTIIASGSETVDGVDRDVLLILDPVLNASSASATAVPEPTTAFLALGALLPFVCCRRARRAK